MTSRQVIAHGKRYMQLLGLTEWTGEFRVVRGLKDADGTYLDGQSWWSPEERWCSIRVASGLSNEATHLTLIHELIHVALEGHLPPMTHDYDAGYEFGLNRLTKALWIAWKGE
jgi:hypothetical protein